MATIINACETTAGWSLDTNGIGTGTIDTSIKVEGTGSIKFVRTVDKARNFDSTVRLNVVNEDWSDTKKIRMWVRTDKEINDLSFRLLDTTGTVITGTSTRIGIARFPFQTTQTESYIPADTWFEFVVSLVGCDLSNVKNLDIQSRGDRFSGWADGETVTVWVDNITRELSAYPSSKKWCVVDFDDGYKSVYQNAFPIMEARGQKGTFSISTNGIDSTHYLGYPSVTSAEVLELYNAGWDIGGHSHTHANLQNASQAAIVTEIDTSSAILESITGKPPTYMSLPFNAYDEEVRVEAIRKYTYIGRGNTGRSNPYSDVEDTNFPLGRPYAYELTRYALSESYNHDTFVRIMNDSYNYGRLPHITFHSVADDGSPVYTTVEKFTTVMDWLFNNGWSVVPATQMYNEIFKSTLTIKTS